MNNTPKDLPEAEILLDIPFFDIDAMGVAWHGHYVKYLEIARSALMGTIDYNYIAMKDSGYLWPVTELKLRYVKPARLGQKSKLPPKCGNSNYAS